MGCGLSRSSKAICAGWLCTAMAPEPINARQFLPPEARFPSLSVRVNHQPATGCTLSTDHPAGAAGFCYRHHDTGGGSAPPGGARCPCARQPAGWLRSTPPPSAATTTALAIGLAAIGELVCAAPRRWAGCRADQRCGAGQRRRAWASAATGRQWPDGGGFGLPAAGAGSCLQPAAMHAARQPDALAAVAAARCRAAPALAAVQPAGPAATAAVR